MSGAMLNEPRAHQTEGRRQRTKRDEEIVLRYNNGARVVHLARDYGVSSSRIKQILQDHGASRVQPQRTITASRFTRFAQTISREHLRAVGQARLQVAQGWAVDPVTRARLGELYDALDQALEEGT